MLRPTFTENLLKDLIKGNSINVHGAIGQGQARLLDDLVPLAKKKGLLVLRMEMISFISDYDGMLVNLTSQLCKLFPNIIEEEKLSDFSQLKVLLDKYTLNTTMLIIVNDFDSVLDNINVHLKYTDILLHLSRLANEPHCRLLVITTQPYHKYHFYVGVRQNTSPLALVDRPLHKLTLREIKEELKSSLNVHFKQTDFCEIANIIYTSQRASDFLGYCSQLLNSRSEEELELKTRLRIWQRCFESNHKKSFRMYLDQLKNWIIIILKEFLDVLKTFSLVSKLLTKLSPVFKKFKHMFGWSD